MTLGLVGRKIGMTRVFSADGVATPVTVIDAGGNRVAQVKDAARDGYHAVQVTVGSRRADRLTKPLAGHYGKAGIAAGRGLWEFRLTPDEAAALKAGAEITVDLFKVGQRVDVQGVSIGKGYTGVMRRHHFSGGRASHGASLSHRSPGSIGQRQTPGRVFPGKSMAGHLGNARRTQQGLEVMQVDAERHLLLIKGSIPGARGADVVIRPSVKAKAPAASTE